MGFVAADGTCSARAIGIEVRCVYRGYDAGYTPGRGIAMVESGPWENDNHRRRSFCVIIISR